MRCTQTQGGFWFFRRENDSPAVVPSYQRSSCLPAGYFPHDLELLNMALNFIVFLSILTLHACMLLNQCLVLARQHTSISARRGARVRVYVKNIRSYALIRVLLFKNRRCHFSRRRWFSFLFKSFLQSFQRNKVRVHNATIYSKCKVCFGMWKCCVARKSRRHQSQQREHVDTRHFLFEPFWTSNSNNTHFYFSFGLHWMY